MTKQKEQPKTNKTVIIALSVIFLVIILALVVLIIHLSKQPLQSNREEETTKKKDLIITEENVNSIREELNNPTSGEAPPTYDVKMNAEWYFQDGRSKSKNAAVSNAETNQNVVYFDVILQDTEEVIYSSPYVSVGATVKQFQLDKDLEQGTYDAICKYYILNDEMESMCTVSVNVKIYIEQ